MRAIEQVEVIAANGSLAPVTASAFETDIDSRGDGCVRLSLIEILLCPSVDAAGLVSPPADATPGACYLVGAPATGAWTGRDGALACFTEGGWRFIEPIESMQLVDKATGQTMAFRSGGWEKGIVRAQQLNIEGQTVVRQRQPAIADPSGGTTVDGECRAAVAAILATLRAHGLIG